MNDSMININEIIRTLIPAISGYTYQTYLIIEYPFLFFMTEILFTTNLTFLLYVNYIEFGKT